MLRSPSVNTYSSHARTVSAVSDVLAPAQTIAIALPQPRERPSIRFYRPELDVLRFFAFFGVFFHHTAMYSPEFFVRRHIPAFLGVLESSMAKAGAYGVDLFFVLSAYLITELLLREKNLRGALDVQAFYIRRALRIWPLYYFFLTLVALVPAWRVDSRFALHYFVPFLFFGGNWSCVVFGFPNRGLWALLWSVCVEEQFYLFWPPIVSRLSRRNIFSAAIAMLVVSNFTRVAALSLHAHHPQIWCNTLSRLDPIAMGILMAVMFHGNVPSFDRTSRSLLLLFGLICLACVGRYAELTSPVSSPWPWMATLIGYPAVAIGCALLVLAVLGSQSRLLHSATLSHLGKISYGLYVYHLLATWITDHILVLPSSTLRGGFRFVLAFGITVFLATISYRFLESPFLNLKRQFTHVPSRPV